MTNQCTELTLKISASTIFEALARFKAMSLPWPLPETMFHDVLEKRIFPTKDARPSGLVKLNLLQFDTEMRKALN